MLKSCLISTRSTTKWNSSVEKLTSFLELNGTLLEHKKSNKFLNVLINANLNWKAYNLCLSNKLAHEIAILKVASTCLPTSHLRMLYMAFFNSHISYAIQFWPSASATIIQPLFTLLNQAIRIIASAPYFAHTEPLFNNLHILQLNDYIKYCKCIFMFKTFHSLFPASITDMFHKLYCIKKCLMTYASTV